MNNRLATDAFWSLSIDAVLDRLQSSREGLTSENARFRVGRFGPNRLRPPKRSDTLSIFFAQFKSPLILILFFATGLSFFLRDPVDASIILSIILVSGVLGFWQERGATNAVKKLLAIVQIKATVLRDKGPREIPVEEIVPGDMVVLKAGDIVPGDCLIHEARDLFIEEAMLTGETFPSEKFAATLPEKTPLGRRTNSLWMGTHVVSGHANALVVRTGTKTEFGKVSERLARQPPETEFERGIRRFGYFLMEITLVLVVAIFAINVYLSRPVLSSFLFSLALAVGLTPQLLPAIISINLAHGARRMAQSKVIVKRLASIENFGSMNVICSDKTGTLTEGIVRVQSAFGVEGAPSEKTLLYAYMNAFYETGFVNPIDEAVRLHRVFDLSGYRKLDEIPYDFHRKRLSILVSHDTMHLMVTKGALPNVLEICSLAEKGDGTIVDFAAVRGTIENHFEEFSGKGFRTLGVAYRNVGAASVMNKELESGMTFLGYLVLHDPPKSGVADAINALTGLGVSLKIITGDNRLVAANLGRQIGLTNIKIITGTDLRQTNDTALPKQVMDTDIFAEIEPNQKERIVLALRKAGNVVGYIGDGINDTSALHAADVGISVDTAVDVAKEAADIVLLERDLQVLAQGVREGRTTFANTLKYVFMATSANFGNMFSMAGASLFLPFLPLLPKQILLTNLMTDIPEMTIATDRVDAEMTHHPRRWNIGAIRTFMITFGIVSSVFDYLTFGVLLLILHSSQVQFRTGWFLESVISASLIVLVIRSRKPFFRSAPSRYLLLATLGVVFATLLLPLTPVVAVLGFCPLPLSALLLIAAIIALYLMAAEITKRIFYAKVKL